MRNMNIDNDIIGAIRVDMLFKSARCAIFAIVLLMRYVVIRDDCR